MRLPMALQREITRLHFHDPSLSHRALARSLEVSPTTVATMRRYVLQTGLTWTELAELDDPSWRKALQNENRSLAQTKPKPEWAHIHAELQRPDATLEVLWREWRESVPNGIGYSAFADGYRVWSRNRHVVMRQVHRPGDRLFVDFAGRTVEIRDRDGGPSQFAQIFVAVLGYSNYTFIHAVLTQNARDWAECHIQAFNALGGVPLWIVPDNLKAAVLRRGREKIELNPVFRACLAHYGTAALPARPRRPRDKGKAEVGVQIGQRWVLFRLRDRVFFNVSELNDELRRLTAHLNAHPFKKLSGSREQRFEVERNALQPLPTSTFEICDWRYQVRVGQDHHVEHLGCHYSVPCELAGKRVDLRFTASLLEILHEGRRIVLHTLSREEHQVVTLPEHRPLAHRRVLEGEPLALATWARQAPPHTQAMVLYHLEQRNDLTNGVRTARRLRDLERAHGQARFEEVCAYALPLNITALRSIESILRGNADRRPAQESPSSNPITHENVRGADYFGESS